MTTETQTQTMEAAGMLLEAASSLLANDTSPAKVRALIHAAPSLLEALQGLLEGLKFNVMLSGRMGGKRDAAERIAKANAAVEKAEDSRVSGAGK